MGGYIQDHSVKPFVSSTPTTTSLTELNNRAMFSGFFSLPMLTYIWFGGISKVCIYPQKIVLSLFVLSDKVTS